MTLLLTLLLQLPIPDWKMVHSLDADQDDRVSQAEFRSGPEVFAVMDANKDGYLTHEEVMAARAKVPAAPKVGEAAPQVRALDPETNEPVALHHRERPFALIFGTHT